MQLLDTGVAGSPAKASAAASPGINVALCQRHDDPLPTTTLSPVTTTTLVAPPPTVPAPVYPPGTWLSCGAVDLRFTIFNDRRAQLERPGRLPGVLTPRLVR